MKTRLSTKGQLIIPKEIREKLGWGAGTEVEVLDQGDQIILRLPFRFPETRIEDLVGCIDYKGPRRSLAEMEEGIARGARRRR